MSELTVSPVETLTAHRGIPDKRFRERASCKATTRAFGFFKRFLTFDLYQQSFITYARRDAFKDSV